MVAEVVAAARPTTAFGGALFPVLGLQAVVLGLQARGGPLEPERQRFPGLSPGDILRGALAIQALSESGLVPVASTDPFTGDLVISTQDQSPVLETLLGEKFARETLAATPEEIEEQRTFRDQVIDSFSMPTARVIGPGVVSRGSRDAGISRRLGGPCAAANTGFSRLNCARGGFA